MTNVKEACAWLSYTYLFVRMLRNPLAYGVPWEELAADPRLDGRRKALITEAARKLEQCVPQTPSRVQRDKLWKGLPLSNSKSTEYAALDPSDTELQFVEPHCQPCNFQAVGTRAGAVHGHLCVRHDPSCQPPCH